MKLINVVPIIKAPKVYKELEIDDQMHQKLMFKKLKYADKRNQQLKALFQQHKQLTRSQIAEALQINLLTATKDLKRLCAEGVIVKKMPTISPQSHFFEIISNNVSIY